MIGVQIQISFILVGAALMLALLGLGVAVIMPGIDQWSKRFFMAYFLCLALYTGLSLLEMIVSIRPGMRLLLEAACYSDSLFASVLMPLMSVYLLRCCGENWRRSAMFRVVAVLWIVFFIMLNMSLFTTWFYYISPENQFVRGPLYPLMLVLLDAIMVLNLAGVIRWRDRLSKRCYVAFLFGSLPTILTLFVHLFASVFELLSVCMVICALSMFALILSDQIEQNLRQQRKIAHQRASIMVLQMRPHFIYNTMMSIYYLCKQNPDLAQQVTMNFTTYLRKNFTAIASEQNIPFSEELEHTRSYLAVEQAQYDDMLVVDWDTPHTHFRLPPLTLQPIVENAVKHGMDPDSEPLRISIRTRHTDSGTEIIAEDNGSGFDSSDESKAHITLENIRQRLKMMCGGSLTIQPRDGGGTVVTVTIPDSAAE